MSSFPEAALANFESLKNDLKFIYLIKKTCVYL